MYFFIEGDTMDIMHVDANSAYLSWTAAYLLEKGYGTDIREIPSVIAGDPDNRHGIILAKSIPAKKFGIKTGESLMEALAKCPHLKIYPPDYDLYLDCSNSMYDILSEYSSVIERYSVDECFIDYTASREKHGNPVETAFEIKERIKKELGFSVNIGVSVNKVLAKMAGELRKPDVVETIYPEEIPLKLWPLPVEELFMVGRASKRKLAAMGIYTVGQLAAAEPEHLKVTLKSHGLLIWRYANGIDDSLVVPNSKVLPKSIGNGMTIAFDATDIKEIKMVACSLCERTGQRLRGKKFRAGLVGVYLKSSSFVSYSHQVKLPYTISSTVDIFETVSALIDQCWKGEPVRQIGVWVSAFESEGQVQIDFFDYDRREQWEKLDTAVDDIRRKFGEKAVMRGWFANGDIDPVAGGVNDGNYIMMGGSVNENSSKTYRYNSGFQQRK